MPCTPTKTRQILVQKLGTNFREVTEIVKVPLPNLEAEHILVKVKYVGVDASGIAVISGKYYSTGKDLPFPVCMEGMGDVIATGKNSKFKKGQNVVFVSFGTFCEYFVVPDIKVAPIPACDPGLLSIALSGPTASVALEKEGDLREGKTVMVTAAAGGTGQFAVQVAKLAGCHVIGTCSSDAKAKFLKSIGCDRPINYKKENLDTVLKKEYPQGMDVVYECVGGELFETALINLANFGRLIVVGQCSKYKDDEMAKSDTLTIPESKYPIAVTLLRKNATLRGFSLGQNLAAQPEHVAKLAKLYGEGKLKAVIDNGEGDPKGPFKGLEKVADAIEYMFAGKNTGKVIVEL